MKNIPWTDKQKAALKDYWANEAISASEIADELNSWYGSGRFSSNAVIGQARRMKLPKRRDAYRRDVQAMSADAEMIEGYIDGCDPYSPLPSANRSAAYRHGFANGRDDLARSPRASAAALREAAEEAIKQDAAR